MTFRSALLSIAACAAAPLAVAAAQLPGPIPRAKEPPSQQTRMQEKRLPLTVNGCIRGKRLVLSAMASFGGAWWGGSAWVGVLVGAGAGALLALLHGVLCSLPRVNDIATGIALMLLGTGLAFYLGKPLIQPQAPQLPPLALGGWSDSQVLQAALQINPLLPLGLLLAVALYLGFARTRWGLLVRLAGDSANATRALGYSVAGIRIPSVALDGHHASAPLKVEAALRLLGLPAG